MAWLEKRNRTYFITYRNEQGKTRRLRASTDKVVARAELGRFETAQARGERYSDPYKQHRNRPLADHVADWIADLKELGRDDMYIAPCKARMERLLKECKWAKLDDINADGFCNWRETAVSEISHNGKDEKKRKRGPMGPRTKNHYYETLRSFCRWCVKRKRMAANPVADVEKVDQTGDVRRARRALSESELARLLAAVPEHHQLAYRIILATGLRRDELRQLRWGDLHLDSPTPFIALRAKTTKARRGDTLPIRGDLAKRLKEAKGDAGDDEAVCPRMPRMSHHRGYLAVAKIPLLDEQGRRADFYALRHTFGTLLSKAGVAPRVAMELMRHTDLRLTMKCYTDPRIFDLAGAVEKLPSLPGGSSVTQPPQATGTDGGTAAAQSTAEG